MKIQSILGKKRYTQISLALIFLFSALYGYYQQSVNITTPQSPTAKLSVTPSPTVVSHHGGVFTTVVSVVDGDTIKIEGGEVVRYIGMNTPETVDPKKSVECYGMEASAKNKELVQGKVVELEKDVSNRDRYGRLLRYVWIEGTLINEVLVREGFAQVSTYPPDVKYQERLIEAQRQARENSSGLWGKVCSTFGEIRLLPSDTVMPSASPSAEFY